ncbi:UNVERIFIED_CONTAM: Aspartate aminotransferase, chloroplastic [Sesamum calycinum]|uniref:Aspartate aminotransferase n=1 Tax=Sesamum calycinum TaxID=2727403 RepID=A0AAW2LY24_9LAMI
MDPPTSWDSLRKQARKLEAQLDEQMHLYRKLVSTKVDNSNDNDLESGIDQLLKQLQQVNVQMQAWVSSGGSEIFSHTLTRHQEIFQDLMQEFKRLHSSQRAKKEHASLLEDFREFDRTRLDLEDGGGSYDQALLKERASLHRSSGQMDSVISQAQETLKSLVFQRSTFGGINSKLSNVSSRLPTMASAILSLPFPTAAFTSRPFLDNLKQANMKLGTPNQSTLSGKDYIRAKSFTRKSMTSAVEVSRFGDMTMAPPDPILGVSEAFRADTHEMKLNLGAENLMLERGENKEYLPIEGLAAFNKVTAELLLGVQNDVIQQQRVATVQGLSGTGSLRLAAALIERYFPGSKVLISSPTWGNHKNIFNDARVPWSEYRYYDPRTVGLDFHGMISDIKAAPEGSFVLLHGCAHNPTGIDPTPEQWESIADVIQEKNHIPFFDVAYQGFASGSLDTDASSVRLFAARGMELLVAQSYSKNLGLYAERIGAINVVCSSSDIAQRVKSQLKRLARPMYSNPPIHGARIVANVVGNPELFNEWKEEMELMAGRIKSVRKKLYDSLSAKDNSGKDWSFVLKQIGMFSFTGLNDAQSENMTNKWHVYMTKDGRISLAGLSSAKCEYLADAIIDSYHNVS